MRIAFGEKDLTQGGKYIPEGRHTVKITSVKVEKSQSSGEQVLYIELVGLGAVEGKVGKEVISLQPKVRWRVASLCKACGLDDEYLKSGEFDTQDLVGKVFDLDKKITGTKVINGQEKKQFQCLYFPAEGANNPLSAEDDIML